MGKNRKRRGLSYAKRVEDINRIYEHYARTGLSNREIWRRYIYPRYAICERTFYNLLKADAPPVRVTDGQGFLFPELLDDDEQRREGYFRKNP